MAGTGIAGRARSARASVPLQMLMELDPAFGSLALWLNHADADGPGPEGAGAPAWTDGRTVFYGPGFAALAPREKVGIAAHQILHVALRHAPRGRRMRRRFGEDFDPLVWNIATDALVNETLLLGGLALPKPCVLLSELLKTALGEDASPEEAIGAWDVEKLYVRLLRPGRGEGGPSRARRYGAARAFRPDLSVEALRGGDGEDDGEGEDAEWAQRLAAARAGARRGVLSRTIADMPMVRTPWEVILRGRIARAIAERPRPSHSRPARRWIGMDADARRRGAPLPGFELGAARRPDRPRIAVAVDVSTSIPESTLRRFAAEIASVGRRTGAEVVAIVFDDGVLSETRLDGPNWEREVSALVFGRGGGTSFVEAIDRIAASGAAIGVVLTDLDGPFGPPPRRPPILWAIPDTAPPDGCDPPFGQVLSLAR
jgi:hypothetical protein